MSYLDSIIETVDEIESFFKNGIVAFDDSTSLNTLKRLCNKMIGHDGYISEKSGQICDLGEMFFSELKHLKYQGGSEQIYYDMLNLLQRIRDRIHAIKSDKSVTPIFK